MILKSANTETFQPFVDSSIKYACEKLKSNDPKNPELIELIYIRLNVLFGVEILKLIDGYVSTELDPRKSYNTEENIRLARKVIEVYEEFGVSRDRVLIKISGTYEGIQAARKLKEEGIKTNITLVFSLEQAITAADNGVFLISPFIGRVTDAYKKQYSKEYSFAEEPGVLLVRNIYQYFRKFGFSTIVMGASLRSTGSCYELAGVDRLTIPPAIIEAMQGEKAEVPVRLSPEESKKLDIKEIKIQGKEEFEKALQSDTIANKLLTDGIEAFNRDAIKLEELIISKLS